MNENGRKTVLLYLLFFYARNIAWQSMTFAWCKDNIFKPNVACAAKLSRRFTRDIYYERHARILQREYDSNNKYYVLYVEWNKCTLHISVLRNSGLLNLLPPLTFIFSGENLQEMFFFCPEQVEEKLNL